jgi:hypothetical protein
MGWRGYKMINCDKCGLDYEAFCSNEDGMTDTDDECSHCEGAGVCIACQEIKCVCDDVFHPS